jgi:NTP pyrophosphatase (non-canonical NTP hydrolase)
MERFAEECFSKFVKVMKEKNRTPYPWGEHSFAFLFARLTEEVDELREATADYVVSEQTAKKLNAIIDETKDVALFAWFINKKAKQLLETTPPTKAVDKEGE